MKTLLMLSVILCVALSIRAAAVVPAEAAAVQQEDTAAQEPEVHADAAVAADTPVAAVRGAVRAQARSQFCLGTWQSYGDSCYFLNNNPDTWRNAERYCADFQGNLASVKNIWEYNFLQRMVRNAGHTFAWIGGYFFEDDWRWEDGSAFNYHNWQTTGSTERYQCLQLDSQESRGWSNHGCSTPAPFICKVKPSCV
ncbi:snaclec A8-like [Symphorus nematophorus]